jgi:hypothetical protein
MKAHELAQKLLNGPDLDVMIRDTLGPVDLSSCYEYQISNDDEDNCGDCEGRVGETVIALGW